MEMFDKVRANAELVLNAFPDADLGYDARSVEWIDGYIERNRESWGEDERNSLTSVLGSFLATCIVESLGASFDEDEYGLAVVFGDGNRAYPINKTGKHINEGSEDSILSFYRTAETLFT